MSFFGFDATLPRDRGHPATAPGFGQAPDPFVGLSRASAREEDGDDGDDAYVRVYAQHWTSTDVIGLQY